MSASQTIFLLAVINKMDYKAIKNHQPFNYAAASNEVIVTPVDRKIALIKKGITQKSIAQKLGVREMCVCDEINGRPVSHRIRLAIAEAIGKDHREVFPDYYLRPPKRAKSKNEVLI